MTVKLTSTTMPQTHESIAARHARLFDRHGKSNLSGGLMRVAIAVLVVGFILGGLYLASS